MILSIDPGLNNIGYTVYDEINNIIITNSEFSPTNKILKNKLVEIYNFFNILLSLNKITYFIYENPVFLNQGDISQKVNFSLGILLLLAAINNCEIYYYSAKQIKKELTGNGNADKEDIANKCSEYFKIKNKFTSNHASDSLAVLITYLKTNGKQ